MTTPLPTLIRSRREAIIERFVGELRRRSAAVRDMPKPLIINALPSFLDEVAAGLENGASTRGGDEAAREHGEVRWEEGFELDVMVREYGVLRRSILRELQEAGVTPTLGELEALLDRLDAGVARAVTEHTRLQLAALETERKRVELERGRSGSLLAHAPAPICLLKGADLVFELANPLFCQMVGRDDLLGKPLVEAVPELRGQPLHAQLEAAMTTGNPSVANEMPVRIAHWTGELVERLYNVLCKPVRDVSDAVEGVMVTAFEVTEQIGARKKAERLALELQQSVAQRLRAEQALRLNEERFRKALRGSPVMVFNQDRELRYTWMHNGFGKSEREVLGKTDAEVLEDPEAARSLDRIKREVLSSGVGQRREIALHVGGRTQYLDISIEPLTDDACEIIGITCTATDITERKSIEQALRASEARFRTVQEASPDGFMILRSVRDASGAISDFEWVYVNPATGPIVGGRGKDLEGKRLSVEMPGSALASGFDTYARVVETGEAARVEIFCAHEGAPQTFRAIAVALGDGVGISFHDITEQKRTEAERTQLLDQEQRARLHAEQLNRLKDEFLATVSHELRTPLQSILGWARILRTGEVDTESLERGLSTIERNAKAQSQLIEDILDASTIIAGKLQLRTDPVDVRQVLATALDLVRPTALAKGVTVHAWVVDDVGIFLGDADRLQQIVWNLLTNAVKFTPSGGQVRVGARRVDAMLEVEVEDNGEGIPKSFLPFLFERFRQADGGVTRAHGGLGLGLAIVRHLAEAQGGTVHAESDGEGKGARFRVRLPIRAEAHPALPSPQRRGSDAPGGAARRVLEGIRVLVVDDETDARELLGIIFVRAGATVREAASAGAALEALRGGEFDVLVSDIGMPGEDGYAMMRRLRALGAEVPASGIPALALTAYTRVEDRRQAIAAGFQMHLAKPIEPNSLVTAVAHLVGRAGNRGSWP
ncbi:PAS domain-containing hybrid sensor histidine kinase/response regulator [Sorangium sp. So ce1335]|uniref:hybrid sensor histidine kinase/response regulator n=1 Tax=Sorangium sp. So ce1335 TaxID=3133335 RepID=UPI003F623B5F